MQQTDTLIYTIFKGKMTRVSEPQNPNRRNFVIICKFGDWSGFRTLEECEQQFPELEKHAEEDGYFSVVER